MDYELGFKMLVGVVFGWFGVEYRSIVSDIKDLKGQVNDQAINYGRLEERLKAVKEDTSDIKKLLTK